MLVGDALNADTEIFAERYASIQQALGDAVKAVHLSRLSVPDETLDKLRAELVLYDFVYSTNYDLLAYWSVMRDGKGEGFKDYFWAEKFDLSNVDIWRKVTKILYLHGAIHLYRLPTGATLKRRAEDYQNLLDLFGTGYHDGAVPLFITEGGSEEKMESIYSSDYLSFAYSQFRDHQGPLVIFGHALDDSDAHLISAIARWGARDIAISLLPKEPQDIVAKKARIQKLLPKTQLAFFDSTTHPLGHPELEVLLPDRSEAMG